MPLLSEDDAHITAGDFHSITSDVSEMKSAIKEMDSAITQKAKSFFEGENRREHDGFKTVMNRAYGAVGLAYILLTCFGGYAISVISELGRSLPRMPSDLLSAVGTQGTQRRGPFEVEKDLRQMLYDLNQPGNLIRIKP